MLNLEFFFNLTHVANLFLSNRAYLDPGSGSVILQLVLAAILGVGFLIKAYWKKLVRLFKRSPDETEEPEDE